MGIRRGVGPRGKNQALAVLAKILVAKTTEVSCILIEQVETGYLLTLKAFKEVYKSWDTHFDRYNEVDI